MPCPFQWLVITDGTVSDAGIRNQVDLVSPSGFCILEDGDWRPAISEPKGGGVWRDSQLADGRRPADFKAQNVTESMTLTVMAQDQDALIHDTQNLRRLLNKARTYGTTAWQDEPVWIEAQSPGESELRYAIIWDYRTPNDSDPYEQPFFQAVARAGMNDFTLTLEREPYWRADEPGTGTAVATSAVEAYDGRNLGNVDDAGVREPTAADEVYVANKRNVANITNVHYWDSNANNWSPNLLVVGLPVAMLPNPVLAADVIVFGIDTTVADSGPFSSLVFDISIAMTLVTGTQWKYSRTGADPTVNWPNLTVQDNTDQDGVGGGMPFDTLGVGSVHWEQPSDWTVQNPKVGGGAALGVTGYWVAMDIVTVAGGDTPPWQDNRDIYSIVWPYVEIQSTEVGGDVAALAALKLHNQSSVNAGAGPYLDFKRAFVGLRSLSRGADFTAYVNFADEQNPAGLTVTDSAPDAAFANWVQSPSGRVIDSTGAVPAVWFIAASIDIGTPLISQYHGTYRLKLRMWQHTGTAGLFEFRVRVGVSGTLGAVLPYAGRTFGPYTFPSTGSLILFDIGDIDIIGIPTRTNQTALYYKILIEFQRPVAAQGAYMYDAILLPIDEWSGQFLSTSVGANSEPRRARDPQVVSIDSVGIGKRQIVATLEADYDDDTVYNIWQARSVSEAVAQSNVRQRYWFLQSRTTTTLPLIEIAATATLQKNQRYESMRGDR